MRTFFYRELKQFFFRPLLYLSAALFLLVLGLFLWFFEGNWNIFASEAAGLSKFFLLAPQLLILFTSALSVRPLAFEKENKTLGWVFTQPISLSKVVWGKFLALFLANSFLILPTMFYVWSLSELKLDVQTLDYTTILVSFIGLILCALIYSALGILASCLANTQIQSFLLCLLFCFLMYFGWEGLASFNVMGSADYWVKQIGIQSHYQSFIKGILDFSDMAYFVGSSLLILWLSITILNGIKRKS